MSPVTEPSVLIIGTVAGVDVADDLLSTRTSPALNFRSLEHSSWGRR